MRIEVFSLVLVLACRACASAGNFSSTANGTYMVLTRTKSPKSSSSASSTKTLSTGHVGNFVAQGLGLSHSSSSTSLSTETLLDSMTSFASQFGEMESRTLSGSSSQAQDTTSSSLTSSPATESSPSNLMTAPVHSKSSASTTASRSPSDTTSSQPAHNASTSSLPASLIASVHRFFQNETTSAQTTNSSQAAACLSTLYPVAKAVLTEDGQVVTATKFNDGEIHVANQTVYPSGVTSLPLCSTSSLPSIARNVSLTNSTTAPACLSTSLYTIAFGLVTAGGITATATKMNNGEIIVANTTIYPDGVTSLPPCPTPTQPPFNGTQDQCWSAWNSWYNSGLVVSTVTSYGADYSLSLTEVGTVTSVQDAQPGFTSTLTFEGTFTTTIVDGQFTVTTETFTTETTSTTVQQAQSSFSGVGTYSLTRDPVFTTIYTTTVNPGPTPNCKLPSSVSQCQASWDSWAAQELATTEYISTPKCTQAAITGSTCSSLVGAYISSSNPGLVSFVAGPDVYSSGYYFDGASSPGGFVWPTSSTIGIGCTIGCGGCAVTGNSVKLLYWPPVTGHNTDSTLVTLGTTLTSPTLYISYSKIYASDHCKGIGSTHYNTIVPIAQPGQLSSLYATPYYDHIGDRAYALNSVDYMTAPFTLADLLTTPVAMSIYSSQPWCASYAAEHTDSALIFETNTSAYHVLAGWTCPTTRPYEPILVPPQSAYGNIDPAWATCRGALEGVYDPPQALTPAAAEASVTLPNAGSPSATPAQSPSSPAQPAPTTVDPEPDHATTGAAPEQPSEAQPTQNNQPKPTQGDSPANSPGPASLPGQNAAPAQSPKPSNDNNNAPGSSPASPSHTIATIGGQTIVAAPSPGGHVVVSSQGGSPTTLRPGQSTTIGDTPVSVGTGNVVVGGNTVAVPAPSAAGNQAPAAAQPIATIGGQTVNGDPSSPNNVIVGGQTLSPGQTAIINNTPLSVGTGNVVVDGSTVQVLPSTAAPAAVLTLPNGQIVTAQTGQPLVAGSQTLSAGGPAAVIDGQTVSMASNGLVVGAATIPFIGGPQPTQAAVVTLSNGQVITALPGQPLVLDGQTLTPGGPPVTVNGQIISLASAGLVEDGSTIPFDSQATPLAPSEVLAQITASGNTYMATEVPSHPGTWVIDGTTFSAGGPAITFQGETLSAASNGLMVDGSRMRLITETPTVESVAYFVDSHGVTHTVLESPGVTTAVVDGSITLTLGGPGTSIDGESLSLGSNGLVVDGTTESWSLTTVMMINGSMISSGNSTSTHASTTSPTTAEDSPTSAAPAATTNDQKGAASHDRLDLRGTAAVVLAWLVFVLLL